MSINYGDHLFSDPVWIGLWKPPRAAGLYAILVLDQSVKPQPYRVIYFGETEDFSARGFIKNHNKYPCWMRESGSEHYLYISILPQSWLTPEQRKAAEAVLIAKYRPACNLA